MHEILPDLYGWPWFSQRHGYNFNGTFLRDPDGNLCIDPVEAEGEVVDRLAKEGVSRILLTNRNHVRAAALLRERTGARIGIHPADADYARGQGATIDDQLEAGHRVGPLRIIGVPGKSPGEIALHDPARRLLVVGDVVIGNPPGRLSLLSPKVMDDPAKLRASVRGLLSLDFDALIVGDGAHILKGAHERLSELVAGFHD